MKFNFSGEIEAAPFPSKSADNIPRHAFAQEILHDIFRDAITYHSMAKLRHLSGVNGPVDERFMKAQDEMIAAIEKINATLKFEGAGDAKDGE